MIKHQVLKKEEVNALIHNAFIPVMLDKETEAFPQHLMPFAVPTLTFVEPKEERKVFHIIGYKPFDEALSLLKQAKAKAKEEAKKANATKEVTLDAMIDPETLKVMKQMAKDRLAR